MFQIISNLIRNSGEFPARIRKRHHMFWSDPEAEFVRNSKMHEGMPLDAWQNVPNWQRRLSNKYNAREFAKLLGCNVADLYWKGRDLSTLDFNSFPSQYVIRPTIGHGSKGVFIMNDGLNLFDQKRYTTEQICEQLQAELDKHMALEFLFEEFVRTESGEYEIPNDFKFLCFNGEVASVAVIDRISPKVGYSYFYDEHWNKMERLHHLYPGKDEPAKPKCFDQMLEQAKILSKAYGIFVRIDFFASDKGAVFCEFTPTPAMGRGFTKYGKRLLLKYWDRYCPEMI
ncbi:ATP-grasp fold amidoligase family protein [Pedobacter sp. SAFR-022]|uniref:ATP-grasp fold amidoligase family protein n=1 Tax=Pedobacter sp. SAFR-022 TaxID=3436861 RepID=UPI003F7E60B4